MKTLWCICGVYTQMHQRVTTVGPTGAVVVIKLLLILLKTL